MGIGRRGTRESTSAQPETPRSWVRGDSSSPLALQIRPLNKRDEASKSKPGQGKEELVWFTITAAVETARGSVAVLCEAHSCWA